MLQLQNGCYASKFSVHPKNWDKPGASTKKDWYIHYRFHDPAFKHLPKYKYGQLRAIKGMNELTSVRERREMVKLLIAAEKKILVDGYHPIKGEYVRPETYNAELNPDTPFIEALWKAYDKLQGARGTLTDIKSIIKGTAKSARQIKADQFSSLTIDKLPISNITRKYFKAIFEQCYKNNKKFTPKRQNKYKAYLSKIFKELIELEVVDINPLRDIANVPVFKKERILLTPKERKKIDDHLHQTNYPFWRAINIFFHSGARETEIMRVQVKDVDITNQRCKYTVKKGRNSREVYRPIKNCVLHLWKELIQNTSPEDYIFSVGLKPGPKAIRVDQMGRRWTVHVKKKLGIQANLYCLKHLNTTEIVELLSDEDAARLNAHTSTSMVIKIYDVNREERQNNRIKQVNNQFA